MLALIARGNATRAACARESSTSPPLRSAASGSLCTPSGVVRAPVKIGLTNIAYNFTRLAWHQRRNTPA
jgi:hypothetical protein